MKLHFVIQVSFLSIFEWPFYTGFTVIVEESSVLCLLVENFFLLFANSLDTNQAQQNVGSDLDPNSLTLWG